MDNQEKMNPVEPENQQKETVSAEMLKEEYEKRSVLTTQGPLKKQRKSGSTIVKIAAVVLVIAVVVAAYFLIGRQETDQEIQTPVPEATADLRIQVIKRDFGEFDNVTVTLADGETYTIRSNMVVDQQGNVTGLQEGKTSNYEVVGNEAFALNPNLVYNMANFSTSMTAYRLVAEKVEDFSGYGLDEPAVRVVMRYRNGSTATWLFGSAVPTTEDAYYYMTEEGSGKVYMAYASQYEAFSAKLNYLHAVPVNAAITDSQNVQSLYVERPGEEPLEISVHELGDTDVSIATMIMTLPFENDVNAEKGEALFEAAIGLQMTAYAGTLEEVADVSGLGEDERTLVRITDKQGTVLEYWVGNVAENGEYTYVCIDDQSAFLAYTSSVEFVNKCTPQYVIDQFSGLVYIIRVNKLTSTTPEDSYEMEIKRTAGLNEDTTVETYYFDGEETEEKLFKSLYTQVIGSLVSKVSDDFHLTGETVMKLEYDLNVEPGKYVVEFITYDDDYYAVRRSDGLTVYLIKKDKVQTIVDAMAQMRNGEYTVK